MKIGIIGDTHINIFRKSNSFFTHVGKAFNFFNNICKKHKVPIIIVCGDLFHTKNYIATDALIQANEWIQQMLAVPAKLFLLPGNHDLIRSNNTDLNLLDNYRYFNDVSVFNQYTSRKQDNCTFHFLPFNSNDEMLCEQITNISIDKKTKNILFSHFGVAGFKYLESETYSIMDKTSQTTAELLSKFDRVFLGHFHGYQTRKNITYVSSPFQSRHGDEHSKHGIVIFDTETLKHIFYENPDTPHFITLEFNKKNIKEAMQLNNHFIRFIVRKHAPRETLSLVKTKLLQNNNDVDYKFEIPLQNLNFTTIEGFDKIQYTTTEDLLIGYVRQFKDGIDHNVDELLKLLLE